MVGNTNASGRGGGSISSAWAYIVVEYPSGSTCRATNGSILLSAEGTTGNYTFQIPEPSSTPETWTVWCTDGSNTSSSEVQISTRYQNTTISLSYTTSRIPSEYQEVEYIKNNSYNAGLELIPETISFNPMLWEVDIDLMLETTSAVNTLHFLTIGNFMSYSTISYSTSGRINYDVNLGGGNTVSAALGQRHSIRYNTLNYRVYQDGVDVSESGIHDYNGSMTLGLSVLKNNSTSNTAAIGRIYSFTIKNNVTNEVLYDFVPCYLKTNSSRIGFYDIVHDTFVYGEHVAKGPDV